MKVSAASEKKIWKPKFNFMAARFLFRFSCAPPKKKEDRKNREKFGFFSANNRKNGDSVFDSGATSSNDAGEALRRLRRNVSQ